MRRVSKEPTSRDAYWEAIRLLSLRRRTVQEVRAKLEGKGYPPAEIAKAIERLNEERLLDDAKYAEEWALSRVPHRLWGRERLRRELQGKGISPERIAQAIQQVYSEYPEEELALRAARRKQQSLRCSDPARVRQKVGSYLQRQGFPFETILKSLEGLAES